VRHLLALKPDVAIPIKHSPMKPLIIGLLCASVASLAFSQTNKPAAVKKNEATPYQSKSADAKRSHPHIFRITNIRTNANGVTAGGPMTDLTVSGHGADGRSKSYPISKSTTFVDQSGRAIDRNKIPSGANAHLEFDSSGAVTRVVLEK
jgi:hypothetical protein